MELDYKEIGKRVKIARIRADLTQEALAEKAGLSITHMSNIENGHSKLSLPMAVALANVLSVSVDEFLCDSVIHSKEVFSMRFKCFWRIATTTRYAYSPICSKQPKTRSAGI